MLPHVCFSVPSLIDYVSTRLSGSRVSARLRTKSCEADFASRTRVSVSKPLKIIPVPSGRQPALDLGGWGMEREPPLETGFVVHLQNEQVLNPHDS